MKLFSILFKGPCVRIGQYYPLTLTSRIFRHWMRLCSTMKSSSGCAATLLSAPILQHVAGWDSLYYHFGVRQPGLLVGARGWVFSHCLWSPREWFYQKTSLNLILLCPVFGPLIRLLGKGKDQLWEEPFDYFFEVANHSVCYTNQVSFIVLTL